jgi:hypothetical protein
MKSGNKMRWVLGFATGAAILALAAGCQSDKPDLTNHGEQFPSTEAERSVFEFGARQAANAARSDGTLRAYHFNDRDLNSLGEERLDAMLYHRESGGPLVVYIDLPENDVKTAGRKETVIAFLKDRRLTEDQIELKNGPNPDSNSPVAPILAAQAAGAGAAPPAGGASATAAK